MPRQIKGVIYMRSLAIFLLGFFMGFAIFHFVEKYSAQKAYCDVHYHDTTDIDMCLASEMYLRIK
jgi:hypothetical protein